MRDTVPGQDCDDRTPCVLLFQRRLTRAIAGGARSVFDRGAFLHELGYKVVFIIMDKSPDHGVALSALRTDGILHPGNDVMFVQDLLETGQDRVKALSAPPLMPDIPVDAEPRKVHKHGRLVAHHFHLGGTLRHSIRYFRSGAIRRQETFDASGALLEAWVHDSTGEPLYIDRFCGETGLATTRRLICAGRGVLCDIDMTAPLGLGVATTGQNTATPMPYASLVARRIEAHFDHVPGIVAIADGENISQNVIRAFSSPGIRGISVLHNNHTQYPFTADDPVKEAWEPFLTNLTNVHKVVALTERQKRDLQERFPEIPLVKVNHPVLPVPEQSVSRDPDTVVFVGRLSYQKRLAHLVDVFAKVSRARPQTRFKIYGGGDEGQWLKAQIAEAGLSDVVQLRGFTERPLEAFAKAALTVMTSYFEGLPLTILEAMSVGTPFVAYDLNYGPAEVIRDGEDGVLVENGDTQAAADAVVALLNQPERLKRMSDAAARVGQRYTLEAHRDTWRRLVEEVANPAFLATP
jgi:poly(glycerol-phosphate) alpha-glucosyltransferase